MNVYDYAHQLAKALKESDEFKKYMELREEVSEVEGLKEMLADFQQRQFELQTMQLSGQEPGPELMEQIQSLYQIIMKDPKAMEYFQSEMVFSRLVSDIYGILGEVIKIDE